MKIVRNGLVAALIAAGGIAVAASPAQADQTWGFRLSVNGWHITTLCVATDRQTVCTGRVPAGHSEVYDVTFNDPNSFRCSTKEDLRGDRQTKNFSRDEFKECLYSSNFQDQRILGKRPDNSEAALG
ncbi:hypothetical protein [Catenuloplanes japonicus]|uniref:hypothetical protein n=1 Tax=Catenuloplanes japonicus TaxID=33876 RepID=UPI0005246090|nr:hypothetical protein [Catenuloplanes japonicus]